MKSHAKTAIGRLAFATGLNALLLRKMGVVVAFHRVQDGRDTQGLSIGRDSSDPVSQEYTGQFEFTGGRIVEVKVNIGDDVYLDVEREFAAAMARD